MVECEEIKKANSVGLDFDFLDSATWHWHLTSYSEHTVAYMAGFVVKAVKKIITCETCWSFLGGYETVSKLQKTRSRGLLMNASESVIAICKTGEKEPLEFLVL